MVEIAIAVYITFALCIWLFIVAVDEPRGIKVGARFAIILFWPIASVIALGLLLWTITVDLIEDMREI